MATDKKSPMRNASTPAESKQELMSGANGTTDPRAINTDGDDRPNMNADAYPGEDKLWGMPITHTDLPTGSYPGLQGKWSLAQYGKKGR